MRMVRDIPGIVCILLMYLALFYADYVVVRWVILHSLQDSIWAPLHVLLFNAVVLLLSMSHLRAAFTDPGRVPLPQNRVDLSDLHMEEENAGEQSPINSQENWSVCRLCETYRPPEASHCFVCNRCIRGMDHHCPWINNCIGERNHRYFLQFLVYVGILAIYSMGLLIGSWVLECPECSEDSAVRMSRFLHSVILFLECTVFGMFVVVVLVDQFEQILRVQPADTNKKFSHKLYLLLVHVYGFEHPLLCVLTCRRRGTSRFRKDLLIERDV